MYYRRLSLSDLNSKSFHFRRDSILWIQVNVCLNFSGMIIIFVFLFSSGKGRKNWEEFVRNNSERTDPIYRRAQEIAIRSRNGNDKGNFLFGVSIAELCGFEQRFGELKAMSLKCSMNNSRTKRYCRATCKNGRYSETLAWAPMQFRV